ncbi:MAG: Sua5/YciO/YrdC/YwlC family protein [Planctomycetes bacterium]|nr:Sua5/YciO/YrdC/YwlC family protein [Planctomycetota bacterium]
MTLRRVPVPPGPPAADLAREAAAAIRAGEIVVLPTETVYGLAAAPGDERSVDRIRELKDRPAELIFTHHVADRSDLDALVDRVPPRVARLLDRYWPGPLTIVLPARGGVGTIGVRLPGHAFTRAVIRELGHSLYLTSVNRSGQQPLVDPDEIAARFGDRVDRLYDAGRPPLEQASTVVRWRGSTDAEHNGSPPDIGELEILREGTLSAAEIHRAAARTVLFVCSGNTCRSPLAQALARRAAARRLHTTDDLVLAHGLDFQSAGTTAQEDEPVSDGSLESAREVGLDLSAHRARLLTADAIRGADQVYCLAPAHLVAVRNLAPERTDHVDLLDPSGGGIPDPYGGNLEIYRQTRDAIGRAVDERIGQLLG